MGQGVMCSRDSPAQEIVMAVNAVMDGHRYYSAGVADALAIGSTSSSQLTQREKDVLQLLARGNVLQRNLPTSSISQCGQ